MLRQSIHGNVNCIYHLTFAVAVLSFTSWPAMAQPTTSPPSSNGPTRGDSAPKVTDLLPPPPSATKSACALTSERLADAPEVGLQIHQPRPAQPAKAVAEFVSAQEEFEKLFARIRQLNQKQTDGFISALLTERNDLAGLPVLLGDSCRQRADSNLVFKETAENVRLLLQKARDDENAFLRSERFQEHYIQLLAKQAIDPQRVADGGNSKNDTKLTEKDGQLSSTRVRNMVLMQMLGIESPELGRVVVWQLAAEKTPWADRTLAQLAVFSPEKEIRSAAITVLKLRPDADFAEVVRKGLCYPWLPVVKQAADFVVQMRRPHLVSTLVDLLGEPDPRAPITRDENGKKTFVVREMVRINHHRNCLLCHAPTGANMPKSVLIAQAPLPDAPPGTYCSIQPRQMIRLDVTYLRQDFSAMLPAQHPTQSIKTERFDFLVRERVLSETEAAEFRKALEDEDSGKLAPHRAVALAALRQIRGKDTPPNTAAWREKLE